jgi:hypothetical protein
VFFALANIVDMASGDSTDGSVGQGCTALFPLAPLLPQGCRVRVADVGALSLGDGGDAWSPLLSQNLCDVVGFEPAPGECEQLNAAAARRPTGTGQLRFFPTFVGDGTPGTRALSLSHGLPWWLLLCPALPAPSGKRNNDSALTCVTAGCDQACSA